MIHLYPLHDEREHVVGDTTTCWCDPRLDTDSAQLIVIHNPADCRELVEQAEEIKDSAMK
jgi:hypothetical protein